MYTISNPFILPILLIAFGASYFTSNKFGYEGCLRKLIPEIFSRTGK